MSVPFDAALLDRARWLGPATAHEAAGKIGALPPTITPVDPSWRIAGPAFTVDSPAGDNLAILRAVGAAEPGTVLVVATGDTEAEWGYWGELMSTAARVAGLEGVVLQGGSRDHVALPDIGFPVFSLGACIRGTSKHHTIDGDGINTAIAIGGIAIQPGDLIVGDVDGVVAIPAADARGTLSAGLERHKAEEAMLKQLRTGDGTLSSLSLDRSREPT